MKCNFIARHLTLIIRFDYFIFCVSKKHKLLYICLYCCTCVPVEGRSRFWVPGTRTTEVFESPYGLWD